MKRLLFVLLAGLILLAGCNPNTSPGVPETSQESPKLEASAAPERLVIGIAQDFDSLDPGIYTATGTEEVLFNVFHGLINVTPEGEIIPQLCESYQVSDDLTRYTFPLRQDVLFHNGERMTAADVAYTYLRLMGQTEDQPTPLKEEFAKNIQSVEVEDEYTVSFQLYQPSAAFLSFCLTGIIPEGSGPEQATSPVGAGPYWLSSYSPGLGLTLERFDGYFGDAPFFPSVEFRILTDDAAVQLALQTGELHVMKYEQSVFTYDSSRLKLLKQPQNMVQMLALNHEFEPFSHLAVRQAINHAVNKAEIIQALSPGSLQLDTHFSPVMSFYYNDELTDYYAYDPQRAKELLQEAGYQDLSFGVRVPAEYKFHIDTAQIIQQQLAQAGITMTIEPIEWAAWLTDVYAGFEYEATIVGLTGKIDPGSVMARPTTDYSRNFFRYHNEEYDSLVAAAAQELDQSRRAELYKEAQRLATADALMVPIMDPGNNILMSTQLEGYAMYPIGYIDLRSITWAE